MRRLLVILLVLAGPWPLVPVQAEIQDHTGGPGGVDAGAVVVGGTPVAIAVVAPSGTLASFERRGGGTGRRWTCGYYELDNGSSSGISIEIDFSAGPVDPVRGQGYGFLCYDEERALVHSWFGIYDPADPFAGLLAAERAAELALEQLPLREPAIGVSPPDAQIVGLRSWLWVDTAWSPSAASASVTGVTSTVTATPLQVTWQTGDGATVTCHGPGVAYDPTRPPDAQASDCTHTYVSPSIGEPGGTYTLTATVTYTVAWTASNGGGGELGTVTRTSQTRVRVVEVQAVIN
jgi:hypothetical protein